MTDRRAAVPMAVVFTLFFSVLYVFTRPLDYSYDGLCYALDVERDFGNLFHPNHLLYSFAQWLIAKPLVAMGYQGPVLYLMQAVNACVSALAVTLLGYGLTRQFSPRVGWTLAALFGFSQAFWVEAADPGCYSFAAMAAVAWMLSFTMPLASSGLSGGLFHGFLALWHQMLIIAAPASFLFRPWRESWRYVVSFSLIVSVAYGWAAYAFHGPTIGSMFYWALGPAGPPPGVAIMSTFWWSVDVWVNLRIWIQALAESLVSTGEWPVAIRWIAMIGLNIAILWGVRTRWKTRAFAIVATLSLFQFFFYIGALRYRILVWPFLLYLLAPTLVAIQSRRQWALIWVGVAAVALLNGLGPIQQRMQPTVNSERTAWVRSKVWPSDFFLFGGTKDGSIENVYLGYFAKEIPARSLKGYLFEHPDGNLTMLQEQLLALHKSGRKIVTEKPLVAQLPGWKVIAEAPGPNGYTLVQMTPDFQPK